MNNADGTPRGGRECPKCMFSMEYLRNSVVLDREEGYVLDRAPEPDLFDVNYRTSLLIMGLSYVWHSTIGALIAKVVGDRRRRKYQEILRLYPHTIICTHCEHIIKQR